jgi:hypothetical protein
MLAIKTRLNLLLLTERRDWPDGANGGRENLKESGLLAALLGHACHQQPLQLQSLVQVNHIPRVLQLLG